NTNGGGNVLSPVGSISWVANTVPASAVFEDDLYVISKDGPNNGMKFYRLDSVGQFEPILTSPGLSPFSFEGTNRSNKGATIYNDQLALLASSNNDNVIDTIVLFSRNTGNTFF
ncbi:unnamed protein product, partial [Ectocarpus fasciculatus]